MIPIRDAGPRDRPAVLRLYAALQDFERAFEPNRLPGEACAPHVDALLAWAARDGFVLLAGPRAAPVGLLIAGRHDEGAYVLPENRPHGVVSDLYVAPEARRKGLGLALLRTAETRFAAAGLRRMEISALAANLPARALYDRWAGPPDSLTWAKPLRTWAKPLGPPPAGT